MKRFLRWKLSGLWKDRFGGVFVYAAIAAPLLSVKLGGFFVREGDAR